MVNMGDFELGVSGDADVSSVILDLFCPWFTAPVYHKGADKQHSWKYLRGIQRHYHFHRQAGEAFDKSPVGNNYKFICVKKPIRSLS